ncbi:MAG: DNA repair protein RecN [Bacteroidales bacterium]|nr:DNA repair protein RecN [Bacteroidales bacterium]
MLKSLQIRNYVLIDSLDVTFPEGLIIITGQTGAGKSILLGALSMLLGSKAESSVIGPRGDNCVVEAVFEIPEGDEVIWNLLRDNDLDDNSREVVARRVVSASGRSRSFINDSPVNLQILQGVCSRLVDIHSQHQTLLLTDRSFQLSMLDHLAGNESLLDRCASSYKRLKSLEREYEDVSARLSRLDEESDYIQSRLKRLEAAGLVEGELESLEEEQSMLANAESIKESLTGAENLIDTASLKEARKLLEKAGGFLPEVRALGERLESARVELNDILDEVSSINSHTEISESRLAAVEERMSFLYDLMKRYSASSISELITQRDSLSGSLADSDDLKERLESISKEIDSEKKVYDETRASLHTSRNASKKRLADSIMESLRSLELERSVFEVELEESVPGPYGSDSVRFLFSASGGNPVDVSKCASGGELSRLMLSLKALMARFVSMPTLIFDEIDSGVSGSVADKMGQMICSMGRDMQVFAITHLPQVAAKGDVHYLVEKSFSGDEAMTSIHPIEGEDRVMEIARMLSGSHVTSAAVENAKSLLSDYAD